MKKMNTILTHWAAKCGYPLINTFYEVTPWDIWLYPDHPLGQATHIGHWGWGDFRGLCM